MCGTSEDIDIQENCLHLGRGITDLIARKCHSMLIDIELLALGIEEISMALFSKEQGSYMVFFVAMYTKVIPR